jgi:hypothetical protein
MPADDHTASCRHVLIEEVHLRWFSSHYTLGLVLLIETRLSSRVFFSLSDTRTRQPLNHATLQLDTNMTHRYYVD